MQNGRIYSELKEPESFGRKVVYSDDPVSARSERNKKTKGATAQK